VHELGIAAEIIRAATEARPGARVTKIVVEVGMLSAVLPDALRFCFDLATEGTSAEGAKLSLLQKPGSGRCVACNATIVMHRPLAQCACGGTDLEWLSGEAVTLQQIEVS